MKRAQVGWGWLGVAVGIAMLSGWVRAADDANLFKPTGNLENWRLEQHEQGKAEMTIEDGALAVDVTEVDGTDWHVQMFQFGLDLTEGAEYVLSFQAKAAVAREIQAVAGIDEEDWHLIGLAETVQLGTEWKDYKCTFTATNVKAGNNRVGFVFGMAKGKVSLKGLSLKKVEKQP